MLQTDKLNFYQLSQLDLTIKSDFLAIKSQSYPFAFTTMTKLYIVTFTITLILLPNLNLGFSNQQACQLGELVMLLTDLIQPPQQLRPIYQPIFPPQALPCGSNMIAGVNSQIVSNQVLPGVNNQIVSNQVLPGVSSQLVSSNQFTSSGSSQVIPSQQIQQQVFVPQQINGIPNNPQAPLPLIFIPQDFYYKVPCYPTNNQPWSDSINSSPTPYSGSSTVASASTSNGGSSPFSM